ncbi:MAG: sensor histidine kinase [Vitreoscilla sp.]
MNTSTTPRRVPSYQSWLYWSGIGSPGTNPLHVQILWTTAFAATIALIFVVLGFAFNAHRLSDWLDLHEWTVQYVRNLEVSLIIAFLIQGLYAIARKLVGAERALALQGWRRTLYFAGIPLLGTAIGWPLGVSVLFGDLHILQRMTFGDIVSSVTLSVALTCVFVTFFSLRVRSVRAEMRANEAQLRLLQGQMEPHFLFNTLANVISLIDADAPRAKYMLEALTDYLRASLGGLRRDDSTLDGELDLARRYLQLMQTRMGDRLRFEIDVDDGLRRASLMPLVLQPLIENAVKHGLEPQVDGGTVRVKASRIAVDGQDSLQICIEDDGPGLAAAARRPRRRVAGGADGNGIALANLRERLQARFGTGARLTLTELDAGTGTRACIVVPWQVASAA